MLNGNRLSGYNHDPKDGVGRAPVGRAALGDAS